MDCSDWLLFLFQPIEMINTSPTKFYTRNYFEDKALASWVGFLMGHSRLVLFFVFKTIVKFSMNKYAILQSVRL